MLGKLLKYDLQAQKRQFLPLYLCFIASAIGAKIFFEVIYSGKEDTNLFINMLSGYFILFYAIAIFALLILTVVFIVTYFYKSMTQDEAYLTMTLPVHTWQIILSKLLSAVIWQFISAVLLVSSALLFAVGHDFVEVSKQLLFDLYKVFFNQNDFLVITTISFSLVIGILQAFSAPLSFYFSIAVGHLCKTHKIMGSIGTYIGLTLIIQNINLTKSSFFYQEYDSFYDSLAVQNYNMTMTIIMELILIVFYFYMANRIFKKRLNLE